MQTIDQQGNLVSTGELQQEFSDATVAMTVFRIAESLEINAKLEATNDKYVITLIDATPEQIGMLERKTNIANWKATVTTVADNVTHAMTQVGDYALNGAAVPVITSVTNAVFTTAAVAGEAVVRTGAGIVESAARNGRLLCKGVMGSKEVHGAWAEANQCISDAGSGLAKLFGINKNGSMGGWTPVRPQQTTQTAP